MRTGELQYIGDTLLIEEFFNPSIVKEAGAFDGFLGGVASSVKDYVLSMIDTSSPGAIIKSILKILEPSMMFRIHPLLGILDGIAQTFGYSVVDIMSSLVKSIAPTLLGGNPVSPEQVNQAGKALSATASLSLVREFLTKEAQSVWSEKGSGAFLRPAKGTGLLYRLFGFVGRKGSKGLLTGFVVWFLKTALAGAGLLAVGSATKSLLFNDKGEKSKDDKAQEMPSGASYEKPALPAAPVRELTAPSSGTGEQFHENDTDTAWVVPLFGGIRNTLLDWATEIYPDFTGYESIIRGLPSFNKVTSLLEKSWDSSKPNYLIVPPGFNRRIDIVNYFAGDAAKKIELSKATKSKLEV